MFFLLGLAITIIGSPSMAAATEHTPAEKTGVASGIIFTIRWLGGSIGLMLITLIYHLGSQWSTIYPIEQSLTTGLSISCLALAGISIVGLAFSTTLTHSRKNTAETPVEEQCLSQE